MRNGIRLAALAAFGTALAALPALAQVAAEHPGSSGGGMPQLDFGNPLVIAQVVWLLIIFGLLYYVMSQLRAAAGGRGAGGAARAHRGRPRSGAGRQGRAPTRRMAEHRAATAKARAEAQAAIAEAVQQAQAEAAAALRGAERPADRADRAGRDAASPPRATAPWARCARSRPRRRRRWCPG